jgi:hypothetical protein
LVVSGLLKIKNKIGDLNTCIVSSLKDKFVLFL